jgi:glutaredoxin
MIKAIYYHAGCPVCNEAEHGLVEALDRKRYQVEIVNLSEEGSRVEEAEKFGVRSLPALVIDGKPFHVNFGCTIEELKRKLASPEEVMAFSETWCED